MGEIIEGQFGPSSEPGWKRAVRHAVWHPSVRSPDGGDDAWRRAVWMALLDPAEAAALAAVLEAHASARIERDGACIVAFDNVRR